jgi:hypothetical protein
MESVGVGRQRFQTGGGQRLETLSSVRRVSSLKRGLQGCRGFATTGGLVKVNSLRWRRQVCFVEGVGQAILGALGSSRACRAPSALACGYRCAARGSAHRRASSLKRGLQGCRGCATTGGLDKVNSLRWRSQVCFVEGVGQAILGALGSARACRAPSALACGYRCAASYIVVNLFKSKCKNTNQIKRTRPGRRCWSRRLTGSSRRSRQRVGPPH